MGSFSASLSSVSVRFHERHQCIAMWAHHTFGLLARDDESFTVKCSRKVKSLNHNFLMRKNKPLYIILSVCVFVSGIVLYFLPTEFKLSYCSCRFACPVCSRSVCDMSRVWERLDQEVSDHFQSVYPQFYVICKIMLPL